MTRKERVRYEMLQRVRDFGAAHRDLFPEASAAGEAFTVITRAVADIETDLDRKRVVSANGRRAMAVMRDAILTHMRVVARTARGMKAASAVHLTLRLPDRRSDAHVLSGARTFILQAEANQTELVRLGLPTTCLSELREATDALAHALTERHLGRSGTAAAQAGISAAIAAGSAAARTLDILVPNAVEHDPELFAAWRRDRRVVEGTSKRTSQPTPEVAAPAQTTVPIDPLQRAS
jgi:hypothetical protein